MDPVRFNNLSDEQLLELQEQRAEEQKAWLDRYKREHGDSWRDIFKDPLKDPRRLKPLPDDDIPGQPRRSFTESNRYSYEREQNDERRSRRSRDGAEDVAMRDLNDIASANGSVRNRRRSRSPERRGSANSTEHSHRDREPLVSDRHGIDRYVGSGRHNGHNGRDDRWRPGADGDRRRRDYRDRAETRDAAPHKWNVDSASERHRDNRDRENRDRGNRGRYDDRGCYGRRRSDERPKKVKTPEPTDDERDRRTVFVQQLAARLRTNQLQAFFEQAGSVAEAQIVKDRVSGRSKGIGYVEFKDEDPVPKAIGLTGQKLLGIPIIVQLTEAEKNRQARNTEAGATQSNGIPFHRLYVGNIHFSITEDDLQNVFEPFGELEFVQLQKEDQGRSKGYGFVQFINPAQAKEALEKMNGFELAGRPIRVGLGNDKFTTESTSTMLQRFSAQSQQAQIQGSAFSGAGGRGAHAGGSGNFDRGGGGADRVGGASALDDTDVGGVSMANFNRNDLMAKLARTEEPEPKPAPKAKQAKVEIEQPTPTRCVLIKNMFSLQNETKPNWKKELEDDVQVECEERYGHVVHISASLENDDGEVYIKFDRVQGGTNAIRGLNGRYFGGRMLTATYVIEAVYHMNYPQAAKV